MSRDAIILSESPQRLLREIFAASDPEAVVAGLPAQSIHAVILDVGIDSAVELLEMMAPAQYRLVLDFDLWQRDRIDAKRVFHWLSVLDQDGTPEGFEAFLLHVDSKVLVALLSTRITPHYSEEATDLPPAPDCYTPDGGFTWIAIRASTPDEYRLLGKALAVLFNRDTEYFYQLLSELGAVTPLEHEEDAYQDRCRRLWDEGIPDPETSAAINRAITPNQLRGEGVPLRHFDSSGRSVLLPNVTRPVPTLFRRTEGDEPLSSVLLELRRRATDADAIDGELALLANAAIVYAGVDYSQREDLLELLSQVRGAMNIGLQLIEEGVLGSGKVPAERLADVADNLGLQRIYQLGLGALRELRSAAARRLLPFRPVSDPVRESDDEEDGSEETPPSLPPWDEESIARLELMARPFPLDCRRELRTASEVEEFGEDGESPSEIDYRFQSVHRSRFSEETGEPKKTPAGVDLESTPFSRIEQIRSAQVFLESLEQ